MSVIHRSVIRVDDQSYNAVLVEGPSNWSAHVPALPGLVATGATLSEVKERLHDGVLFHLEGLARQGTCLPGDQKTSEPGPDVRRLRRSRI